MAETLIPIRYVPGFPNGRAPIPLLALHDTPATRCTGPDGDSHGTLCLCHWSPWVDRDGFPEEYDDPVLGDPFAEIPAAEPWRPVSR